MKELRRSIGAALLILIALLLTFKLKSALHWSPDFVIPVLAASAFFIDAYSLALLALLAAWVLDWQAGLPPELWIVLAAPLAAFAGKKFLPSRPWATLAAVIGISEVLLYVLAVGDAFWANAGFIVLNVIFAVLLGLALLKLQEGVYGKD